MRLASGIGGGIQVVATIIPIIGCLFLCVPEDSGYTARAALSDMAPHFGTEPEAYRGMLDGWVAKGTVVKLPSGAANPLAHRPSCGNDGNAGNRW